MIDSWDNDSRKLIRSIKMSPQEKLEWLYAMHTFVRKTMAPKRRKAFFSQREKVSASRSNDPYKREMLKI